MWHRSVRKQMKAKRVQRSKPAVRTWTAAMVLLMVATACGGDPAGDAGPEESSREQAPEGGGAEAAATVTEASTEPTTVTTQAEAEGEPETLAEYLGYDFDDPDAAAAQAMETERRAQELIARCMAQEGFEYVPATRPMSSSDFAFDEETFAREQGFGITTRYVQEDPFEFEGDDWVDPNWAIVEALSDSEREAYERVLYGDAQSWETDSETGDLVTTEDPWGEGCEGEAYEEVYGAQNEVWEQLGPEFEELMQRLFADPRFQEASKLWAVCMADRGYPYESIEQMYEEVFEDFQRRFDEIVGSDGGWVDPFEGWTQEEVEAFMAERSEKEINDLYEQARQQAQQDIDQDALAALQQEERDLAVVAFECQQDLTDTLEELQQEYEGRFVRENRDLLEQLRV